MILEAALRRRPSSQVRAHTQLLSDVFTCDPTFSDHPGIQITPNYNICTVQPAPLGSDQNSMQEKLTRWRTSMNYVKSRLARAPPSPMPCELWRRFWGSEY